MTETMHKTIPVAGYQDQPQSAIDLVNAMKENEERILRGLDQMAEQAKETGVYDGRWLSIGRTHLEQAFMAINRSIFKPGRAKLPEDTPADQKA